MTKNPLKISQLEELAVAFDHFLNVYHAWALHEIESGNGEPEAYHLQRTDIGMFLEWWMRHPERLAPYSPKRHVIVKCRKCGEEIHRASDRDNAQCFYCKSEGSRMAALKRRRKKRPLK